MCQDSIPEGSGVMWVEFVLGSLLAPKTFFSRYFGVPLSSKINKSLTSSLVQNPRATGLSVTSLLSANPVKQNLFPN